ncbi:MAG: dTMP kinase [Gemmatimonadetes bacterium]|nr:dTMP kinase [Gemmatimonadota bacterium]
MAVGGESGSAFIAIEGPEGAGKTTLAQRLASRLRNAGADVLEVREPGGTPVAEAARRLALDPDLEMSPLAELFLMLAARADLVSRVIRPALASGRVVITDRFDLSTEAYQVAGRGLPRKAVLEANRLATGELKPHLTIVLDLPDGVGEARQAAAGKPKDRMEREAAGWHARVGRVFAGASGPAVIHIDGTCSPEEVELRAWEAVRGRLGETFPKGQG